MISGREIAVEAKQRVLARARVVHGGDDIKFVELLGGIVYHER
jgi:hypothetical protein